MPPPHPEVRTRSVGSATGRVSVTAARPSTSEISSATISPTAVITCSIHR